MTVQRAAHREASVDNFSSTGENQPLWGLPVCGSAVKWKRLDSAVAFWRDLEEGGD